MLDVDVVAAGGRDVEVPFVEVAWEGADVKCPRAARGTPVAKAMSVSSKSKMSQRKPRMLRSRILAPSSQSRRRSGGDHCCLSAPR